MRGSNVSIALLLALAALFVGAIPAVAQEAASSCVSCHSGQQGRLSQPVSQWRESIHAGNGIGCSACHGGDPSRNSMEAMRTDLGFKGVPSDEQVPDFCGQCHPRVRDEYLGSAHGKALGGGGPSCITCHGSHDVQQASLSLINEESCTRCHGFERAADIRSVLDATDQRLQTLQNGIRQLHRLGFNVSELHNEFFNVRNLFHSLFHTVDIQVVESRTGEIQTTLDQIRKEVSSLQAVISARKKMGGVAVGLLALTTVLLFYIRHTYHQEEREGSDPVSRRKRQDGGGS